MRKGQCVLMGKRFIRFVNFPLIEKLILCKAILLNGRIRFIGETRTIYDIIIKNGDRND